MKPARATFRFVRARIPVGRSDTTECSVAIRDGRIDSIDASADKGVPDVDLRGMWLLPGAIDAHVHFDEPGFTHREDFASGTRSASAGGVTTVVDMPCTSLPPVTDAVSHQKKLSLIAPKAQVDFALWGGVRGNEFEEAQVNASLQQLASRGVSSIKTYLTSGMETFEDLSRAQLEHVMRAALALGLTVGVHAEDRDLVAAGTAREKGVGADGPDAYARARSAEAEARGVATCVELAEKTGARVHVVHLGCADGVEMVRAAHARGVSITAETCPHFLAFTLDDLKRLGSVLKTAPVVKSSRDRDALWAGLVDGTVCMVATDHAPGVWPEEKNTGSFWSDYGGVPAVELLLPYVLSEGVRKGPLELDRALELLCANPARIHGLSHVKGGLRPGADADFVVFDPNERWTVHANDLQCRQRYTPFEGWTFEGRVLRTYVRGVEVFDRTQGPVGSPHGVLVRAQSTAGEG